MPLVLHSYRKSHFVAVFIDIMCHHLDIVISWKISIVVKFACTDCLVLSPLAASHVRHLETSAVIFLYCVRSLVSRPMPLIEGYLDCHLVIGLPDTRPVVLVSLTFPAFSAILSIVPFLK